MFRIFFCIEKNLEIFDRRNFRPQIQHQRENEGRNFDDPKIPKCSEFYSASKIIWKISQKNNEIIFFTKSLLPPTSNSPLPNQFKYYSFRIFGLRLSRRTSSWLRRLRIGLLGFSKVKNKVNV